MSRRVLFIDVPGAIVYKSATDRGLTALPPYENMGRWGFKIRYLCHLLHLDAVAPCSQINHEITEQDADKIVIIGSVIYEAFIRQLREAFPAAEIGYYYDNVVRDGASISPAVLRKYDVTPYSWDTKDCARYGMTYQKPAFQRTVLGENKIIPAWDICFIGRDKGRYKQVMSLKESFQQLGIRAYIRLIADFSFTRFFRTQYSDPISYQEYLDVVSDSKALLDLVQRGQVGPTRRVMEAIFSGKKLVTNNTDLVNSDLYCPDNIFILGQDPIEQLPAFLASPFRPLSEEVLNSYSMENRITELSSDD